jgi:hypothetical protein
VFELVEVADELVDVVDVVVLDVEPSPTELAARPEQAALVSASATTIAPSRSRWTCLTEVTSNLNHEEMMKDR